MDLLLQFLSVVLALAVCKCLLLLKSSSTKAARLPPGPNPFPVIGNLLQLGKLPHRNLAKLSKTYGPLMSLRLGSIYTVVVSSSDLAQQILTKHDLVFSSRIIPEAARAHDCHKMFTGFLPIGPQWRKTRKLSKEKLFTTASLAAGEELRRKEVQKLHDYIEQCCRDRRAVNIGEAVYTTTLNLISAALFSTEVAKFESNDSHEFKNIANGIVEVLGEPNLADYFPLLRPFDPQGIRKRSGILFQKVLTFIEGLIRQRLQSKETSPDSPKKNDFLEALLDLSQDGEYNFTVDHISRLLTEFVAAGTHTTAATSEWALTELLLNPDKLVKVKQELTTVIGENNQIQESDFSRLPYFQAVIKEVFRCHIPGPFFVPRKSEQEVEINGYMIPKGTQLLINAWAIAKDPTRWSNPDSFEPERFLENKIEFKGQDFDLLPFSAGRRMCPGMPLADRMLHMIVATLVHNFDWKLESSFKAEEATAEVFGLAVHKAVPLMATPIKMSA